MKKILIFLTIISLSFGANAEYNVKLPKDVCNDIAYTSTSIINKMYQLRNDKNDKEGRIWLDSLAKNAVVYQTYCKD